MRRRDAPPLRAGRHLRANLLMSALLCLLLCCAQFKTMARIMQTARAPKSAAAKRKAKAAEEDAAAARQVRQRVVPKKKEELQPIEHASHNKVGPAPGVHRRRTITLSCWCWAGSTNRVQRQEGLMVPALPCRWRARGLCLVTATAASWAWARR